MKKVKTIRMNVELRDAALRVARSDYDKLYKAMYRENALTIKNAVKEFERGLRILFPRRDMNILMRYGLGVMKSSAEIYIKNKWENFPHCTLPLPQNCEYYVPRDENGDKPDPNPYTELVRTLKKVVYDIRTAEETHRQEFMQKYYKLINNVKTLNELASLYPSTRELLDERLKISSNALIALSFEDKQAILTDAENLQKLAEVEAEENKNDNDKNDVDKNRSGS